MITDGTGPFVAVILMCFLYQSLQEIRIFYEMRKGRMTYAVIYRQSTQNWQEREKLY